MIGEIERSGMWYEHVTARHSMNELAPPGLGTGNSSIQNVLGAALQHAASSVTSQGIERWCATLGIAGR